MFFYKEYNKSVKVGDKMSELKQFIDQNTNIVLANARIPDDFIIGGMLNQQIQSEAVPFTFSIHAINQEKGINIFGLSKEAFIDYRNFILKQSVNLIPNAIKTSFRDYVDPEPYIRAVAESIFGGPIELVAKADLPSITNMNKQATYNRLMNRFNMVAQTEAQGGMEMRLNNYLCEGLLLKYSGNKDGKEYDILAGADLEGLEFYSPMSNLMGGLGGMLGGLFGKKEEAPQQESNVFGHSKPCDYLEWGSSMRFVMIAPKEIEEEAEKIFIDFVSSYQMDNNLAMQFDQLVLQRAQLSGQQAMQMQMGARQSQMNAQYQQQKLTNMLAQNSSQINAGIMDSWDKKMASQSRMSNNFSEAIRGVNTYQAPDGKTYEASVGADHVYQDKYGDAYEVSGKPLDNEVLSKLNWTEINKK